METGNGLAVEEVLDDLGAAKFLKYKTVAAFRKALERGLLPHQLIHRLHGKKRFFLRTELIEHVRKS